ncbi:MAG TPA: hypothetical protein VHB02_04330 [Acidimicrobiales bacterium]|nr:hypothetical protein [Acidimicrobiales bacterium]
MIAVIAGTGGQVTVRPVPPNATTAGRRRPGAVDAGAAGATGASVGLAFLLGRPLGPAGMTPLDALQAVEWVTGAVELVDGDRTSDVVLGSVARRPAGLDLALLGVTVEKDGQMATTAAGAGILGHPARALVQAARTAAEGTGGGAPLVAGTVVYVGRLVDVVPLEPGASVVATFNRLGTVAAVADRTTGGRSSAGPEGTPR